MKQHALVLKGRRGEKIFNEIYNGPKVPYQKLKEESEEIKKQWVAERQRF
jgi:hypothetical protein